MLKQLRRVWLLLIAVTLYAGMSYAQTVASPTINVFDYGDNSCIRGMSDNGKWAVSFGPSASNGSLYGNARLIDVTTGIGTSLEPEGTVVTSMSANDVTDDGKTVVGQMNDLPAVWRASEGWTTLPLPEGWLSGQVDAVTPDGKLAAGRANDYGSSYKEHPVLWNIETKTIIETPNYPKKGILGEDDGMVRFDGISADGRYLTGIVSYSYMLNRLYFLYDREKADWVALGFDKGADGKFTPLNKGFYSVDAMNISANGEWIGGVAYMVKELESSDYPDEYRVPFTYHVSDGQFKLYDEAGSRDHGCVSIDNKGTLFVATPPNDPLRTLYVRSGNYWIGLDELLEQNYNTDFFSKTGYDNTGTPIAISADGKTMAVISSPYESYIISMNEEIAVAAGKVKLLKDYSVMPMAGQAFSKIKNVSLTFSRAVKVLGKADDITLKLEDGTLVAQANSFTVSSSNKQMVEIGFRTRSLEDGKKYVLTIPAGSCSLADDETNTNELITVNYTGRAAKPVEMVTVAPTEGSSVTAVNLSTNPVLLTFDTQVQLTDTAKAVIYRNDETEPFCDLQLLDKSNSNQVLLYPVVSQNLYLNNTYRFVVSAGSIADVMGDNANRELAFIYQGAYERIIVSSDTLVYKEDFSDGVANMLLYDGDHLMPTEEMQAIDFNSPTERPWIPVKDDNGDDMCAASTSAYYPAGKADDWMVTPQCYIPDHKCVLSFQTQSYRKSKADRLKVMVWTSERVLSSLSAADVEEMKSNGVVIFDEQLSPGSNEEVLAGDWTNWQVSLSNFSGKSIYVAFVNENEDQSIVFVDNVKIVRNNDVSTAITTPEMVVAKNEVAIEGKLIVRNEKATFNNVELSLLNSKGELVDKKVETNINLKYGTTYSFAFNKALPLVIGEVNNYTVAVKIDEVIDTVRMTVKNLSFSPIKRVVVEKATGMDCGFCPAGILGFEYLEKVYGDRVVPIAYHTYVGDLYESGMTDYTSNFLKLVNSPTAKINRGAIVSSPMEQTVVNGEYHYSFFNDEGSTWASLVGDELAKETEAELNVTATYDEATERVSVPVNVKYALSESKLNHSIFVVVTENGLPGYQCNYYAQKEDENLGEWGKGGSNASSYVTYTFNEVARTLVGDSYYGTTGYLPANVEGGKEYKANIVFGKPAVNDINNCEVNCMLINANTGKVINVAKSRIVTPTAIQSTMTNGNDVKMRGLQGAVELIVPGRSVVTIYGMDGRLVNEAEVQGKAAVATAGMKGIFVVKVTTEKGVITRKVMVE